MQLKGEFVVRHCSFWFTFFKTASVVIFSSVLCYMYFSRIVAPPYCEFACWSCCCLLQTICLQIVCTLKVVIPTWRDQLLSNFRTKSACSVRSLKPEFTIAWHLNRVGDWHTSTTRFTVCSQVNCDPRVEREKQTCFRGAMLCLTSKKKLATLITVLNSKATEKKVTLNGAYPGFNTYFEAVVIATFFGGTVAIHV